MRRADNDTWDLASSVGAAATMVAAARAVATRSPDPLISDPFAESLVKAVGIDFFARLAGGELQPSDIDDDAVPGVQQMADVMAVRTRYFDQFFTHAAGAGARQAVILASGLDSRVYRLRWPAGTTVFEIGLVCSQSARPASRERLRQRTFRRRSLHQRNADRRWVNHHLGRLCRRLDAPNRVALVARAYALGLLDPTA